MSIKSLLCGKMSNIKLINLREFKLKARWEGSIVGCSIWLELGIQGPDLFCASCVDFDFIPWPSGFSSVKWERSQIFWGSKRKGTTNAQYSVWHTQMREGHFACAQRRVDDSELVVAQNQEKCRVLDLLTPAACLLLGYVCTHLTVTKSPPFSSEDPNTPNPFQLFYFRSADIHESHFVALRGALWPWVLLENSIKAPGH